MKLPSPKDVAGAVRAAQLTTGAALLDFVEARPDDPLEARDPAFIEATLPAYKALIDVYFRPKVRGLELIPEDGPVLLVGNHSGGTLIVDTLAFSYHFHDHFGTGRRFHALAHDLVFAVPGLAGLRKYGTIPANHETAERALDAGAALLVYPGGDHESYRPSTHANRIEFGGRKGYLALARKQRVPIVPVVAVGGQETALFLTRGRGLARRLRLDRLRLKVLPVQLAPPFGITVFDLPTRIPLPAQLTIQVLPPIDLEARFGPDADPDRMHEAITGDMQRALDELAAERDLPVVGTVGRRADHSEVADALAARS